jgi:2-keto-4-pentenoate hydratase/2-oxohepta-3-ene-1,7-dioic acid hydratase in catechol pathway
MRLVTYRAGREGPRPGAVIGGPDGAPPGTVLDLARLAADFARQRGTVRRGRGGFPTTMLALIEGGPEIWALAREVVAHGVAIANRQGADDLRGQRLGLDLSRVRLDAPIPRPRRNVFCLGRNYREHAAERGAEAPSHPVYFTKPPECVVGPESGIVHHAATRELDHEVELAVVIGTGGRDLDRATALEHVFGYTVINDVTARDLQKRHGQWFKGKSLDTFCPMGPVLVTADEIPDPQALAISLRVNGDTRQSSHTSKMIFPVAECIEVLSLGMTLCPGDVIATGTPEGVGAATGRFLQPGDRVEAEVERIGVLANPVVAPR